MTLGRINFGPLVPTTIGFDRLFDALESIERSSTNTYPPHNIVKVDENNYVVELAVSGFKEDEIEIEKVKNELVIKGEKKDDDKRTFLHRGIAARSFRKTVQLASSVQVNGASLQDGILSVELENIIPKEDLPKRIPIASTTKKEVLLQE